MKKSDQQYGLLQVLYQDVIHSIPENDLEFEDNPHVVLSPSMCNNIDAASSYKDREFESFTIGEIQLQTSLPNYGSIFPVCF